MFCVPLNVLLSLFGGVDSAAWEEADDDNVLIVIDADGREHVFISDVLARRNDPYALNIPWNIKNWAAIDAALAPDHAWMPPAVGVHHWLVRRRKLGMAACGCIPAPTINNSS